VRFKQQRREARDKLASGIDPIDERERRREEAREADAARKSERAKTHPNWLVIRNCSDPQINGALRNRGATQSLQAMWAVYYYRGFGYCTTVNSAIATWAAIAGL